MTATTGETRQEDLREYNVRAVDSAGSYDIDIKAHGFMITREGRLALWSFFEETMTEEVAIFDKGSWLWCTIISP